MTQDPVLWNEWHPVAWSRELLPGATLSVTLLEEALVLWRRADGALQAWDDRCPHRGARLSLGRVVDDTLACPYHGWRFDGRGHCVLRPAQPGGPLPAGPVVDAFHVRECHGLVWVCVGTPSHDIVPFEEAGNPRLRDVLAGPYDVHACGPRVVENFIDMAHFGFVHDGILGDATTTEVPPYDVEDFVDATGRAGVRAVGMTVHQPRANPQATAPAEVRYGYRISRPLQAILTKHVAGADVAEAISLFIQPIDEEHSRVWMVFCALRSPESDDEVRAFQDAVFAQDKPILESQRPKPLPLQVRAELAQRADLLSAHYRRYLRALGLVTGVSA